MPARLTKDVGPDRLCRACPLVGDGTYRRAVSRLHGVTFEVADLPGLYLGKADGNRVQVDNDAGGNGWFIGSARPMTGSLPRKSRPRAATRPGQRACRSHDLLTAVLHEMGHALGLDDTYAAQDRDNLMYGFLTKGERRLPAPTRPWARHHTQNGHSFPQHAADHRDLPAARR